MPSYLFLLLGRGDIVAANDYSPMNCPQIPKSGGRSGMLRWQQQTHQQWHHLSTSSTTTNTTNNTSSSSDDCSLSPLLMHKTTNLPLPLVMA
eukprot:2518783-Ditylum_brightwellii.AAC.1